MKNFRIQLAFIAASLILVSALLTLKIATAGASIPVDNLALTVLLCLFSAAAGIFLSLILHVVLHESGHLVFGLANGFRFRSFRIGSLTIIKSNKGWTTARYSIQGTGGQCLMDPPRQKATVRQLQNYLLGGVCVNLLLILVNILLLFLSGSNLFLSVFLSGALFLALPLTAINLYPFKGSSLPNDICNYLTLERDPMARDILINQLKINSCLVEDVKVRDLDPDLFRLPADIDYSNFIHVNAMLSSATYLMEKREFDKALNLFNKIRFKARRLPSPIRNEVKCNVALIYLVKGKETGDYSRFRFIFDAALEKYAGKMKKYMPDKYTLLIAWQHLYRQDEGQAGRLIEEMKEKFRKASGSTDFEEEFEFLNKFILD